MQQRSPFYSTRNGLLYLLCENKTCTIKAALLLTHTQIPFEGFFRNYYVFCTGSNYRQTIGNNICSNKSKSETELLRNSVCFIFSDKSIQNQTALVHKVHITQAVYKPTERVQSPVRHCFFITTLTLQTTHTHTHTYLSCPSAVSALWR